MNAEKEDPAEAWLAYLRRCDAEDASPSFNRSAPRPPVAPLLPEPPRPRMPPPPPPRLPPAPIPDGPRRPVKPTRRGGAPATQGRLF